MTFQVHACSHPSPIHPCPLFSHRPDTERPLSPSRRWIPTRRSPGIELALPLPLIGISPQLLLTLPLTRLPTTPCPFPRTTHSNARGCGPYARVTPSPSTPPSPPRPPSIHIPPKLHRRRRPQRHHHWRRRRRHYLRASSVPSPRPGKALPMPMPVSRPRPRTRTQTRSHPSVVSNVKLLLDGTYHAHCRHRAEAGDATRVEEVGWEAGARVGVGTVGVRRLLG